MERRSDGLSCADSLIIDDGPTRPDEMMCSSIVKTPFISEARVITLRFKSDASINFDGFLLEYRGNFKTIKIVCSSPKRFDTVIHYYVVKLLNPLQTLICRTRCINIYYYHYYYIFEAWVEILNFCWRKVSLVSYEEWCFHNNVLTVVKRLTTRTLWVNKCTVWDKIEIVILKRFHIIEKYDEVCLGLIVPGTCSRKWILTTEKHQQYP